MPINSRQKGARGERAFRDLLREHGYEAHRGCQFSGKSPDGSTSPDINCNLDLHFEVKHCQSWPIQNWIAQAKGDSERIGNPWVIAAKRNHSEWTMMMSSETFFSLIRGDHANADSRHTGSGLSASETPDLEASLQEG